MVVALFLTVLNFVCAELLAHVLNVPTMEKYIRLSALMIPFTAGYFICVGIINGLRLFVIEAVIATLYPLLRLSVIPYVQYIFPDSAVGTVTGFFTAAAICCLGGTIYLFAKRKNLMIRPQKVGMKTFASNMTNFLLFFSCVTIILNIDMLFVNALVADEAHVGYYTGAVNFAKVSYYLLSAIYIVVLPVITKYYADKNKEGARVTISSLSNAILLLILPIVMIVGATSKQMLSAFYRPEYAVASGTATLLMCSQFFIGLFVVINMCIAATKEKRFSTVLAVCITVIDLLLCYLLVSQFGTFGAALASFCAGLIGCIISFIKASKLFGKLFDHSAMKLFIWNVVLFAIIRVLFTYIDISNIFVLFIFYGVTYFAFIGIMILMKQVSIKKLIKTFSQRVK